MKLLEQVINSKLNSGILPLFSLGKLPQWENSEKGTNIQSCDIMWADMNCGFFFFVSHIKSCSGIIDSLVLPWPLVVESFYYRIKNEDSKFQSKGLQLWVNMHFLAFLIVSFSQGKKWTSKLMSYQMHNYSKELYKYICAYLDGCVSELWLLHSQPAAL